MELSDPNTIPENVRRDIFDFLRIDRISWAGRLGEVEFLNRIFDLDELPSDDRRFSTAEQDIWQHRVNNYDWDEDWVYGDNRFDLLGCPDEVFLQFLCEMLHPIVRSDANEVTNLVSLFNDNLKRVGWELREQLQLGGRPVYAAHIIASAFSKQVSQVATRIGTEYISQQINRMERAVSNDPELAIGTAKEFVETICKTVLDERKVTYSPADTFPKLVRTTLKELKLAPDDISRSEFASETIRVLLQNLATISDRMAELRGHFGTGHGKSATTKTLSSRHARLAVGAGTTLGVFVYETHVERLNKESMLDAKVS